LDAAPPDPAAGRAIISLFKLRAQLAALPDAALSDYAASKVQFELGTLIQCSNRRGSTHAKLRAQLAAQPDPARCEHATFKVRRPLMPLSTIKTSRA